ncbi:MAG: peptidoglycan-binding domain-containing protein, partial [Candidatus Pacebacteria bacterium]|nr:peptidoglycan-binding domain-containing protein [Candidatus Paceibacterota bacterium]
MSKKLLGLFAGIVFAVSVMVVPVKAEIPDIGDLSKYSNDQLIEMILEMLAPGSSAGTDTTTPQTGSSNWVSLGIPQGFQFNTNLKLGMTSNDVKYLQIMLNSDPDTAVAITGAGSKGNETTYFGGLTQQAVVKFQEKYASTVLTPLGLTKGTGLAGAGTRVKLNEMLTQGVSDTPVDVSSLGMIECVTKGYKWDGTKCYTDEVVDVDVSSLGMIECVTKGYAWNGTKCYDPKAEDGETPVVKPVEGAGLEVALASDSPATSLVTGQSAAPLAKFVLTNKDAVEAKITRVELQRIGVSADATLANVYLFQGLTRLTDSAAISQGKIAFNNPNGIITVPAGSSVVLTVASDIDTGTSGQTIGISLNSVQSNVEVKALPVRGHVQTVADAELAKVTVGTVVPESEDSVNAGTANYTVFQAPLTVSKRAVNLKAVTLKAIGSIPTDAFENVQLYVNGVEVGSPIVLTSEGMATFILDTPHEIQSGSAILEVRADIVKGSSRNFSFSLQNAADLIAVDTDYNVYTQVAGVPKTTALVTINEGTVSVSQDSTFDATTVTGGVSNAVLAKYSFKAFGENVKVSYLDVESSVNLDNVSIYVNGAPVTSNVNYTGSKLHFSLGSSLIIPAGEAVSVEVRGDTKVNGEKLTDNTNIKMTLVPYTNNAQGVSSSKMITVPSIKIEGQELTVGSGALTISKRSGVADSNISPNTDNQRIGAFTIQAGDSEAVRINNFNVNLGGTLKTESLSNLYIKYGSSETTPRSVQANNNFTAGGVVIPAGESMNVDVYADVHSVLAKPN